MVGIEGEMKIMENENVKNEVTLFSEVKKNMYCSLNVVTEEDKKMLFNALETCDVLLNDCVGAEFELQDIYCEEKQVLDEETGELKNKFRTILFDSEGKTYATGSYGIYNVIKKIITIYGLPTTWEKPLKVKVAKRPIGNGKQSLTLQLL